MRWEDYGVVRRHSRRTDDGIWDMRILYYSDGYSGAGDRGVIVPGLRSGGTLRIRTGDRFGDRAVIIHRTGIWLADRAIILRAVARVGGTGRICYTQVGCRDAHLRFGEGVLFCVFAHPVPRYTPYIYYNIWITH